MLKTVYFWEHVLGLWHLHSRNFDIDKAQCGNFKNLQCVPNQKCLNAIFSKCTMISRNILQKTVKASFFHTVSGTFLLFTYFSIDTQCGKMKKMLSPEQYSIK